MLNQKIPTAEFYEVLQNIYHIFNEELFSGELPNCLITVQRKKRVMGYFSSHRWVESSGDKIHELALNPAFFTSCNFIEVFQTVVHEMCHLWQFEFGKPSRSGYHNKEWANKMESIGLMPSNTGKPGGKRLGQSMNDYPIPGGTFESVCIELYKKGLFIKWFDRFPEVPLKIEELDHAADDAFTAVDENEIGHDEILENLYTIVSDVIKDIVPLETMEANAKIKQKTKYICEGCRAAVWGKPCLNIKCNDCKMDFITIKY